MDQGQGDGQVVELLVDLWQGDDPGVDDVVQLEDDQAVSQVGVHPVDVG